MSVTLIALIMLLVGTFYTVGRQIILQYRCIDDQTMEDFFNGRLKKDDAARRQVITHLGHCEKCQQKLFEIQKGRKNPLEDHLIDKEE